MMSLSLISGKSLPILATIYSSRTEDEETALRQCLNGRALDGAARSYVGMYAYASTCEQDEIQSLVDSDAWRWAVGAGFAPTTRDSCAAYGFVPADVTRHQMGAGSEYASKMYNALWDEFGSGLGHCFSDGSRIENKSVYYGAWIKCSK